MGRIVANVRIASLLDPEKTISCDALVDTGAAYMVLPNAWRDRLGKLHAIREVDCETATGDMVKAKVCGPVEIRIEDIENNRSSRLFTITVK